MPDDNRISAELTAAAVTAVEGAIATIRTNLPFLISLTNDERRRLVKLGDNRLALDEDAFSLMTNNPSLVPSFVDTVELGRDRTLRTQLDDIRLALQLLLNDIEGTEMAVGSDMLMAYLSFYANAREAAKRGVPGAQAIVDVLSTHFARGSSPSGPTPPEPEP